MIDAVVSAGREGGREGGRKGGWEKEIKRCRASRRVSIDMYTHVPVAVPSVCTRSVRFCTCCLVYVA